MVRVMNQWEPQLNDLTGWETEDKLAIVRFLGTSTGKRFLRRAESFTAQTAISAARSGDKHEAGRATGTLGMYVWLKSLSVPSEPQSDDSSDGLRASPDAETYAPE